MIIVFFQPQDLIKYTNSYQLKPPSRTNYIAYI